MIIIIVFGLVFIFKAFFQLTGLILTINIINRMTLVSGLILCRILILILQFKICLQEIVRNGFETVFYELWRVYFTVLLVGIDDLYFFECRVVLVALEIVGVPGRVFLAGVLLIVEVVIEIVEIGGVKCVSNLLVVQKCFAHVELSQFGINVLILLLFLNLVLNWFGLIVSAVLEITVEILVYF